MRRSAATLFLTDRTGAAAQERARRPGMDPASPWPGLPEMNTSLLVNVVALPSRTLARRGSDQGQHCLDHLAVGETLLPGQRAPSLEVCGVATGRQDPGLTLALCLP